MAVFAIILMVLGMVATLAILATGIYSSQDISTAYRFQPVAGMTTVMSKDA